MLSLKPFFPSETLLKLEFLIDGKNVGLDSLLKDASINFELNKIPFAKFTFISGQLTTDSKEKLPTDSLVRTSDDKPIEIEVKVSCEKKSVTFFKGIVKSLNKQNDNDQVVTKIECKDVGFKLALPAKVDENNKDKFSDKLKKYTSDAKLKLGSHFDGEYLNEAITHNSATVAWDYLVGFLDSVGIMTALRNGEFNGIDLKKKPEKESYVAENGLNVFSFSGKKDPERIKSSVTIETWDIESQAIKKFNSDQKGPKNEQTVKLNQSTYKPATLTRIADVIKEKSNIASVHGKVTTYGNLEAKAGDYIGFSKVNKDVDDQSFLITAEVHTIENGCWKTEYTYGFENEKSFTENTAGGINNSQAQVGQSNSINGLQIGIVTQIEEDPDKQFRVKVRIPVLSEKGEGVWARLATLNASKDMGSYFIPNVNDEVIIGCLGNNPDTPIVLGSLYSNVNKMPFPIEKENYIKGFVTKEGTKIIMDDEKKIVEISTKKGNKITISDDAKGITLEDENKNKIVMDNKGITIESSKDFNVKAKGNVQIEGMQNTIKSSAVMELKGSLIKLN
ncbi:phage baseplate assembly protein V [Chryseobacterium shigense]|uniref:Phage baseplate assembly protein gpV n=1 Tax=Chryseobacterium shigense TaxID=297244 RepID=A0A841NAY0_9FLAO|nr:phage baseplate assembly protein V [Chryseobacterium shigense]MBB6369152.1 phage baseplate assembly protein gpV [Chryseobacterium shigense]